MDRGALVRIAGYVRVSGREQETSGLGLAAQKAALSAAAAQREGTILAHVAVEVASAAGMRKRPVLRTLLDDLDAGKFDGLIVSRLDRLARSVGDFAGMLDRADKHGWTLICLSPAVDMGEPYGRMMAQVAASFAELERSLISIRTREGLEQARARGTFRPGAHHRFSDETTIARIMRMNAAGDSLHEIKRALEAEGVPTKYGGKWTAKQVSRIIDREAGNIQ
jgi:DNA invertase Pin-like site-specific DNA recombinase